MGRMIWFAMVFIIIPVPAFAYIDPGLGSMFLQGILAGLIAIGVFWRNVLNFVREKLRLTSKIDSPGSHNEFEKIDKPR